MVVGSPVSVTHSSGCWSPVDRSPENLSTEAYDRLDELWDLKWQGDGNNPAEHPYGGRPQLARWSTDPFYGARGRFHSERRHPLNVCERPNLFRRSASCVSLSQGQSQGQSPRWLLQRVKSWLQHLQDKRRGIVYTNSGPCQLFSDWGIPPYPEDYDWDQ